MDLFANKIIPIVVIDDADDARPLGEALVAAGLPIAEVLFRTDATAEAMALMSEVEGLTVGAGTVLTPAQVELAVEAGAQFLVSPGLRPDVVREARLAGKPIIPGAVTPGEVMHAQSLGLDTVNFFPAGMFGGSAGILALASSFTATKFIVTGGVSAHNMAEYLTLDCVSAVGGSWMVPVELIRVGDFNAIGELCRETAALAATL